MSELAPLERANPGAILPREVLDNLGDDECIRICLCNDYQLVQTNSRFEYICTTFMVV